MKQLLRDWLPPVLTNTIRRLISSKPDNNQCNIAFEGDYQTWEEAQANSSGYNQADILEKVKNATLKVKNGEAVYERDSVLFDHVEYAWPVLAGLMWVAAQNQGKLHALDFGGSLGSSYFQNRQFLSSLTEVTWSVVEQSHFVECGREFIADDCLRFYSTIDECLEQRSPHVILLSSVLQYLESPHIILEEIGNVGASLIILDRTIVNKTERDIPYNQIVPPSIYSASYPCWSLSEDELIKSLSVSYHLVSDFPSLNFPALKEIESIFKGFIFIKKTS